MDIKQLLADKQDKLIALSDAIWDAPETAFTEFHSAGALCQFLENEGFLVKRGVAGIQTAFTGAFGSGKPVIGFLGEFDALSGLSQESCVAEHKPLAEGANGHGCGHNLLGVASLAAALTLKEHLQQTGSQGTVIFFGCPGEEGGSGKTFMAREGVFDQLDCALTWHPNDVTAVFTGSSLANYQVLFRFEGVASHAASSPHLGRSALDAVELMNIGVNFLREHVIPEARMHYAITNSGGFSPNVVQPEAEVLYLVRAPKVDQVQGIYERVCNIARGAALMTDAKLEIQFIKACSNLLPNHTLECLLYQTMLDTPLPAYTADDHRLAAEIRQSISNLSDPVIRMRDRYPESQKAAFTPHIGKDINDFVAPYWPDYNFGGGSTDVGDVSYICPTAQIFVTCNASGTPGHSWQYVAQGKSAMAHKGMLYAAEVMGKAAIALLEQPELISQAQAEHQANLGGQPYQCPIPKGISPKPINQFSK